MVSTPWSGRESEFWHPSGLKSFNPASQPNRGTSQTQKASIDRVEITESPCAPGPTVRSNRNPEGDDRAERLPLNPSSPFPGGAQLPRD